MLIVVASLVVYCVQFRMLLSLVLSTEVDIN